MSSHKSKYCFTQRTKWNNMGHLHNTLLVFVNKEGKNNLIYLKGLLRQAVVLKKEGTIQPSAGLC